jgi:hypothetical protein
MASLYPHDRDSFRSFVDDVDDLVAQDINDLFDALVAIETELGVDPSGDMGTISSRLEVNIDLADAKWRALDWDIIRGVNPQDLSNTGLGLLVTYDDSRFRGVDTEWGDGVPAVFVAPQLTNFSFAGVPWAACTRAVREDRAGVVARDGLFGNLDSSTVTTGVSVGVLAWGIRC